MRSTAFALTVLLAASTLARAQEARTPPAWAQDGVLYEVFPRQFSRNGDFSGITAQLDRLKDMGVTIVWLMPVNPLGQEKRKGTIGSPYAVKDYEAINPDYGTPEDLKRLVTEAHTRGMKVIVDVVLNHTAWDNRLIERHPEWYHHDDKGNVRWPEDWTDVAWLDYRKPELRQYVIGMLSRWLKDYGIDGFRCDVAFMVPTDFWVEARRELTKVKPDILMLAEGASPDLVKDAFDLDYAWPLHTTLTEVLQGRKPATALRDTWNQKEVADYPRGAWHMLVADDHDERRAIARFGEPGALAASFLVFTMPGVPLIYNGMEVGDTTESRDPYLFEKLPIFWKASVIRPQFPIFYKAIAALRRDHDALRHGTLEWRANGDETRVLTFVRKSVAEEMLVALNVSNRPFTGTVEAGTGWQEVPLQAGGAAMALDSKSLSLDAWQGRVFVRTGGAR